MRRILLTMLLCLLSLLAFLTPLHAQAVPQKGNRYALLIGVQRYEGTGLQNLKFCENDVTQLAEVLRGEDYGYQRVVVLTRSEAEKNLTRDDLLPTAANIQKHLEKLLTKVRPEDTVLLAFAGHGVQLKHDDKIYLCPSQCNLDKTETLISLDSIYKQLKDCKANEKILLVDACRNDPQDQRGGDERLRSVSRPQLPALPGGMVAMFSCSKGQTARENEKYKHGYLFKFVIEGLKGHPQVVNPKTGEVSWLNLAAFVTDEVKEAVTKDYGSLEQTPEITGEARGLVLGRIKNQEMRLFIFSDVQEAERLIGLGCDAQVKELAGRRVKKWQEAAESKSAGAQWLFGLALQNGGGVEKNEKEAVKWFQKAADQGFTAAQASLGYCYKDGSGVKKDGAFALHWFREAENFNYPNALFGLGLLYDHGIGVPQDTAKATEYCRKATELGDPFSTA